MGGAARAGVAQRMRARSGMNGMQVLTINGKFSRLVEPVLKEIGISEWQQTPRHYRTITYVESKFHFFLIIGSK